MKPKINISIDGHSGCGKGTLANYLAKSLNYFYYDSGAMYRAVALFMIKNNITSEMIKENTWLLNELKIEFKFNSNKDFFELYLNNELAEKEIKSEIVAKKASEISKIKEVNNFVIYLLKKSTIEKGNVVFGRDSGTKVLPAAELKIYMVTNPEIRAKRVYNEMLNYGTEKTYDEVLKNIKENDIWDLTNAVSPLSKADDAIILDNTNMSKEEQGRIALTWAKGVIAG